MEYEDGLFNSADFTDAVEALYERLREEGKT
jgi:hypothetical protein